MRNTMPGAYTAVPVTFAGMAVTLPESPVTFDRNTQRLAPDMFPLLKQVQIAADFSRGVSARLAGVDVPTFAGQEKSFGDLDVLLTQTLAFLDSVNASQFEGKESAEIVLRPGTPKEKKLSGQTYLANYGLPQFFFHVTTSYDILRHNGLPIGKRDFMGAY